MRLGMRQLGFVCGLLAVRAESVKSKRVFGQLKPMLFGDSFLFSFYKLAMKLYHFAAALAHHVVVVFFWGYLKHRVVVFKVVPQYDASGFKLCEYAVNGSKTDIFTLVDEGFIDILGAHVVLL